MTGPSMWMMKYTVYTFFNILRKMDLSKDLVIPRLQVEKLIRRHKSRYDTSPIIHSAYNDSLI